MAENKMLIDATHPEETRVVVLRNGRVEEFDYESAARKLLRGSIFLAKITRVEPSLQAAFVDYGGNRHGFLAFNEIHPDYYQIPHSDRQALLEEEMAYRYDDDDCEFAQQDNTDAQADERSEEAPDDKHLEAGQATDDLLTSNFVDDAAIEAAAIDVSGLLPPENDDQEPPSYDALEHQETLDLAQQDQFASSEADDDETRQLEIAEQAASHAEAVDVQQKITVAEDTSDETDQGVASPDIEAASDNNDNGEIPEGSKNTDDDDDGNSSPPRTIAASSSSDERIVSEIIEFPTDNSAQPSAKDQSRDDGHDGHIVMSTGGAQSMPELSKAEPSETDDTPSVSPPVAEESGLQPDLVAADEKISTAGLEEAALEALPEEDGYQANSSETMEAVDTLPLEESVEISAKTQPVEPNSDNAEEQADAEEIIDEVGDEDDALGEMPVRRRRRSRSYKIQEVIKRRQVVLVQVVKEERGNKGAALTTYLSLAGRYTVLMPNTARGGGISRKITSLQDRKRLKAIVQELDVPDGMGLIVRTAGASRTKQEIKRDFEHLLRLWESVRDLTLQSTAPSLVYEEGNLIKRSIRDLYSKEIDQVMVAGEEAHKEAKSFMRMLMPSHAKNVTKYEDTLPLFTRYKIEPQLNAMFSPFVQLKSGGYLVINQTEALVAVDVNSGKATKKFSIEETALNTNLEAAEELARQLKLRDLAGLIIIDFIDMEEKRNNRAVERKLKDCLRSDRARIQVGRISHFGLLEMSRQRLRTGVLEGSTMPCQCCLGTGTIRSTESVALAVLRSLEDNLMGQAPRSLVAHCSRDVAMYLLNHKRNFVLNMEARYGVSVHINASDEHQGSDFSIERMNGAGSEAPRRTERSAANVDASFTDIDEDIEKTRETARDEGDRRNRRRRRRRGRRSEDSMAAADNDETSLEVVINDEDINQAEERDSKEIPASQEETSGRRRRGRRGGRRNRTERSTVVNKEAQSTDDAGYDGRAQLSESTADINGEHKATDNLQDGVVIHHTSDTALFAGAQSDELTKDSEIERAVQQKAYEAEGRQPETTNASDPAIDFNNSTPQEKPASQSDIIEFVHISSNEDTTADTETKSKTGEDETENMAASEKPHRSSRGEPISTAPVLERVVMRPQEEDSADQPEKKEKPARKGWWQHRFGG